MEENNEQKVNTEELKSEASSTVNQVKDTIKNVNIKKDTVEAKGFIGDMFKDPLGTMQEVVNKDTNKFFKYAIIIVAVWIIAEVVRRCFSLNSIYGYSHIGQSILSILITAITPIIMILVMSLIIFVMNKNNKKSLITVLTVVTTASVPLVIASIVNILTIFSSQISMITTPFNSLCNVISIVLMYFAAKTVFGTEKNSDFIKKFVAIEAIYYIAYFVLAFLKIYI